MNFGLANTSGLPEIIPPNMRFVDSDLIIAPALRKATLCGAN
jgi:hypothetical protein